MKQLSGVVVGFLKTHAASVCTECLAARVELPLRSTKMVTLGLRRVDGFEMRNAICSLCHRRTSVVGITR